MCSPHRGTPTMIAQGRALLPAQRASQSRMCAHALPHGSGQAHRADMGVHRPQRALQSGPLRAGVRPKPYQGRWQAHTGQAGPGEPPWCGPAALSPRPQPRRPRASCTGRARSPRPRPRRPRRRACPLRAGPPPQLRHANDLVAEATASEARKATGKDSHALHASRWQPTWRRSHCRVRVGDGRQVGVQQRHHLHRIQDLSVSGYACMALTGPLKCRHMLGNPGAC